MLVMVPKDNEETTSPEMPEDPDALDAMLASSGLGDIARLAHRLTSDQSRYIGAVTARLVELGCHDTAEDQQLYINVMRLQRERLEEDGAARRDFALHPRSYGRPSNHLITEGDDWVVSMIETEIETMSADDLASCRHHVIMRVGRQGDIHPDFRPLLLKMAMHDGTLSCLAAIETGEEINEDHGRTHLLAAVAQPFIDVVMADADDGIELEAAAWAFAQDRLARVVDPTDTDLLIKAVRQGSSLLRIINTSRKLAAEASPAQALASLATRVGIAEFTLAKLVLLATKPATAGETRCGSVGAFIRRETVGSASLDLPKDALETWAMKRPIQRLLNDLILLILLHGKRREDLPAMPAIMGDNVADIAGRYLADLDQTALGQQIGEAIHHGWYFDSWAEEAA